MKTKALNPILLFSISICIITLFYSCKPSRISITEKETFNVLILLSDGFSPSDLVELADKEIDKMKKVSKSQNQWLVMIISTQNMISTLIEKLDRNDKVIDVQLAVDDQQSNATNLKASKSNKKQQR